MALESQEFIKVGRVNAHGLKGELYVRLFAGRADWLDHVTQARLIAANGSFKVVEILRASPHKEGLIMQVSGVTDRNQSEALRGYEFAIPAEALVSEEGEDIFLGELLNFVVTDSVLGEIGTVRRFESNGEQDLLVVGDDEILIPLIPEFIEKINHKDEVIAMNLPPGLVEINKKGSSKDEPNDETEAPE